MKLLKKIKDKFWPDYMAQCDGSVDNEDSDIEILWNSASDMDQRRYARVRKAMNYIQRGDRITAEQLERVLYNYIPMRSEETSMLADALVALDDPELAKPIVELLRRSRSHYSTIYKAKETACRNLPALAEEYGAMSLEEFFRIAVDPKEYPVHGADVLYENYILAAKARGKRPHHDSKAEYFLELAFKRRDGWSEDYMDTTIEYESSPRSSAEYFVIAYRYGSQEAEPHVKRFLSVLRKKYFDEACQLLKERAKCSDEDLAAIMEFSKKRCTRI